MLMAVSLAADEVDETATTGPVYTWDGPAVTRGDKTLTASGSTKWTTTGTGADRSMTQKMT